MDVIYVDRLFLINGALDYLIALCSARLVGIRLRRWRYALAALFGALYAVGCVLPGLEFLRHPIVKLCAGVAMAMIAYGGEEKLLRCCLTFFLASALFGGAVWAIASPYGDMPYISVSLPVLVISFAAIYAILSIVFRRSVKSAEISVSDVDVVFMARKAHLRCLHDSGSSLYDPISGGRVLISSAEHLAPLFPDCAGAIEGGDIAAVFDIPAYRGRLRLIPYSAVGTGAGTLLAFRPDSVAIDGKERDDVIVAVSPTPVGGDGFDSVI